VKPAPRLWASRFFIVTIKDLLSLLRMDLQGEALNKSRQAGVFITHVEGVAYKGKCVNGSMRQVVKSSHVDSWVSEQFATVRQEGMMKCLRRRTGGESVWIGLVTVGLSLACLQAAAQDQKPDATQCRGFLA